VTPITASILYNYIRCPQRVALDLFGDISKRDPVNPFVQLLWDRGNAFELEVVEALEEPFLNLRDQPPSERIRLTTEAMATDTPLIYGGRIHHDDMIGEPDLLRFDGNGYVAGDIKSGAGVEGESEDDDGKPKTHYAVQLAFYTDVLRRIKANGRELPFVWDIHNNQVCYDLAAKRGPRVKLTMWDEYQETLQGARALISGKSTSRPAWTSDCKLCHWRSFCLAEVVALDDPSLISGLGRKTRDKLLPFINSVEVLASPDLDNSMEEIISSVDGVGQTSLERFRARARLQKTPGGQPYYVESVIIPPDERELFFDVETDPMRDICYLHGFIERFSADTETEKYIAFLAESPDSEEEHRAFAEAWEYVNSFQPTALFFYSPYERTTWRKLAERYPDIASREDVDTLFSSPAAFDLYHGLTYSKTIWPTRSLSIKELASFLGFSWRDPEPSGAASVQWYHAWCDSNDTHMRKRILEYNEDDCRAMCVLADAARRMQES